ncbi:PREDICTED: multimerin-1 isoform X2 [Gavialis gangeticus]|uniref:multimerin-1 isoform X2 n=1 Tax=Gavialis gangeticus TaxID=94835 RepID=UPI00092F5A16|nr:PREDICTED: multimerin-1 isoform X2 [Gavialis gangeticus]
MKKIIILLLLSHLQFGSLAVSTPAGDGESQASHSDFISLSAAMHSFRNQTTPPTFIPSQIQASAVSASQDHLEKLTSAPTEEVLGLKALPGTQAKKSSTPTTQPSRNRASGHTSAKPRTQSSSTRTLPQSIPKKVPPQQVVTKSQIATGNRSPRPSFYSTNSTSTKQNASVHKSSFETTRGKNWCAYVHTRLLPTVVIDNLETFSSSRGKPCTWITGGCGVRSQTTTHQVYRIKHKIVTSLEWKCCPGYSGQNCQPKAQQHQLIIHSNQAESNQAINGEIPGNQQDLNDPVTQKMNEQISSQEMKLTFLQKKVDNISAAMSDVSKMLSSLEGKINEDKGRDFQSFLKGLKSTSISELVKDIVREQFKVFQSEVQETVAQIFKTMSSLSEDLESTKELVKHLNDSHQKIVLKESQLTKTEILELKNQIVQMEEEIVLVCDKPIKDLQVKQKSLEGGLKNEQSRSIIYYESLNKTLTQLKAVHEQLLLGESESDQNILSVDTSMNDTIANYMSILHEKVKKQDLMVLQLYDNFRIQDSKISNLTVTLEIQRETAHQAGEDILLKCRKDFQTQMKGAEENVHVLNKTLSNILLPLDNKMDKMNEQINDLCYDMEILQPLIEQGAPFSLTAEYEQQIETETVSRKLENLTTVVNNLSSIIKELTKSQVALKSEAQIREEVFERRINECFMEIEDGLNNTMIIINNAVDTVQDNYVLKDSLSALKKETEACCSNAEKLDSILSFIPQFLKFNESLQILFSDKGRYQYASEVTETLSDHPYKELEKGIMADIRKVYQILNRTSLKVDEHHRDISLLEEKLVHSVEESKDHGVRLQSVESKMTKILTSNCLSLKKTQVAATERDQMVTLQLLSLSSRIKALEAKSIRFSNAIPLLNKTVYDAWARCKDASVNIQKVNSSVPQLIKLAQPDIPLLQRGLKELTESVLEIKAVTILTNLTWYVDKYMADAMSNITRLQKQMKQVAKKPATGKKVTANVTTSLAGRSQRNADNTIDPGQYLACASSPCQNGGTCINDKQRFVCACRHPFGGVNCSTKLVDDNTLAIDFSKGSYRYAPMVAFFASHTYGMTAPGPIRFNNLDVNYGASFSPATGKFHVPYLGVYVFGYNIESFSPRFSGYLVVDEIDKLAFQSENVNGNKYIDRVITGGALLELNYGQEVWLRLATGSIPAKYPPVTTFTGYLLYRT